MNLDDLLEEAAARISQRVTTAEAEFLRIAGARLAAIGIFTPQQVREYLYSSQSWEDQHSDLARIRRVLNAAHRANVRDIGILFTAVTAEAYREAMQVKTGLVSYATFRRSVNPMLQGVLNRYEIMARSTTIDTVYRDTVTQFVKSFAEDTEGLNFPTAMRTAIRELTDNGITTVNYRSGRSMRMDSAVRNSMMTEYTNIVQNIQRNLGEEIGADAIEISAHEHPADDHEDIQGHIFTLAEWEKLQSGQEAVSVDIEKYEAGEADFAGETFQIDRPIGMWNCRHIGYSFILGVSVPSHSEAELEAIQKRNDSGVTVFDENDQAKRITLYEAEQEQRRLELELRRERENNNLLKQVKDTDDAIMGYYRESNQRLTELRDEYRDLGKTLRSHGIREKWERTYVPAGSTGRKMVSMYN